MSDARLSQQSPGLLRRTGLFILIGGAILFPAFGYAAVAEGAIRQGGFVVTGRVSLPDGRPAARVKVFLETPNGLKRETLSDDQGNYEFRGIGAGRYRLSAINPDEPKQYSDRAESDNTRAFANRVQVDIYLRLPHGEADQSYKPGTVNVSEAIQKIPKPARKAHEQGLKAQKENRVEQALAGFNQALEIYPQYFQALTDRGNLLMQQNKLAEAMTDFERALQINGQYSPALRGAGYCNIQQRKYEVAIGLLEKSLIYEPKIALTHMLLGYANLSLNRYEQAKRELQQALKLGPDSVVRARVYLAEVFAHEQRFKEAADEIRTYLRLRPEAADAESLRKLEADWRARGK
jgi:tetratricopeptide (TPR) repeat protein